MKSLVEGMRMLKFQYFDGQKFEVEGWMVDFAMEKLEWMLMMKVFHYHTLEVISLLFSFLGRGNSVGSIPNLSLCNLVRG